MEIIIHSLLHALKDTIAMIPLLFIVFFVMDYLELKYGNNFNNAIQKAGKLGPIIGSVLGIIPQCGISILAVGFYSQNLITLGTMISVFIATSDEAIPILLSKPDKVNIVLPLILTKLILGIIIGYIIDFIFKNKPLTLKPIKNLKLDTCCDCNNIDKHFHEINSESIKNLLFHTFKKLVKLSIYILIVTFLLNIIFEFKELSSLIIIKNKNIFFQIAFISLLGLIPNCATSVALIEVFLREGIKYSALIAGLSANAGLALILLFKDKENRKNAFFITIILYISAIISGILTNIVF